MQIAKRCTRWPGTWAAGDATAGGGTAPGVPHEAINLSASETARAIVARNDPAEQDRVVPYAPAEKPAS